MGRRQGPEELRAAIARHIRARRRTLGLTQEELAERAGLSANYIARLEIAMNAPSLVSLSRLAEALQVDLSALVNLGRTFSHGERAGALATMLEPLDEREEELLLTHVRSLVGLIVSLREEPRKGG